jgi:DNA-binding transcriptional regulator YhcF (GntR family)
MDGRIDSSFTTEQRDLFSSGMVAEIGVNAYAVWQAIKFYADFNTGEAFPGMRTLGQKLGLSPATVQRAVKVLQGAKLLRVTKAATKRRGQTYVARERLRVTLGERVLCTIIVDYVPNTLRMRLARIEQALATGEKDPEAFAEVEIIPGPGFAWDEASGTLRGRIEAREIPPDRDNPDAYHRQLGEAVLSKIAPNLRNRLVNP